MGGPFAARASQWRADMAGLTNEAARLEEPSMKRASLLRSTALAALLPMLVPHVAAAQSMPASPITPAAPSYEAPAGSVAAPPTLTLAPEFSVRAQPRTSSELALPTAPGSEPALRHRSVPLMVTGITLTSLASAAAMIGGFFVMQGIIGGQSYRGDGPGPYFEAAFGLLILGGGAVVAGAGVPLWVYGAHGVPAKEASAVPTVRLGNRSVALSWRF